MWNDQLLILMDTVVDGMLIIDDKGVIQVANKSLKTIFGYELEDLCGKSVNILMPEPYHSEHDGYMKRYLETGKKKVIGIGREVLGKRKNGEIFPMDLAVNDMRMGEARYFVGTLRDISERKKAAMDLEEVHKSLKQKNEDLKDFTYVASHDLRSPLFAIQSIGKWFEEEAQDSLSEKQQKQVHLLNQAACQMEEMLDDVLEYAKAGGETSRLMPIPVAAILKNTQALIDFPQGVSFEVSPELEQIMVPEKPVDQVFFHLVSNAVKYQDKEAGYVRVTGKDQIYFHAFSVTDNGPGIPEKYHKEVFSLFKRVGQKQGGTGIGLAIVRKLVERAGGTISLSSEEGKGTTFTFTWPKY